jgi:hypothetical protein
MSLIYNEKYLGEASLYWGFILTEVEQVKEVLRFLHKAYLVVILRNIVCKCIKFSLSW